MTYVDLSFCILVLKKKTKSTTLVIIQKNSMSGVIIGFAYISFTVPIFVEKIVFLVECSS